MKKLLPVFLILLMAVPAFPLDVMQNVARSFVIEAPALDKTDGVTPETGLTMTTFVIKAYKKNKAPITITAALAVFASSIITNTANVADGETVTFTGNLVGNQSSTLTTEVYRFKNTLAQAYDVKIGGTAAITWDNLKCAINDTGCGGEGTDWGTGTVASVLVNATTNTDTQQTVVANIPGTIGNSFTTAETSATASWTGSTLASGVDGMIHDASGYHWFCAPATTWDTLGDMLLTFNYNGDAAPFFQKVRVVANRSDEMNVQGLGATSLELLQTNLSTVTNTSAWAYKLNNLDIATSAVWDRLIASHTVADSFGARLARTTVDSRPVVVDASGLVDANTVKIGPTGSGTAQTSRDIGASVLLSSGTGTGQVKLSSGYVAPNWGDVGNPTSTVGLTNTTIGTLTTYTGNTPQTGDSFARLGAPAGASVSADIAAIEAQTDDIGAAGAGLTALATAAALDTVDNFLDTEIIAIKTKTDFLPSVTAGSAGGVLIAGANAATTVDITGNINGSLSGTVGGFSSGAITESSFATTAGSFYPLGVVDQGTAQSTGSTSIRLRSAASFASSELVGLDVVITGGTTGVGQVRKITSYNGANDTATVATWTTTPTGTVTYRVQASTPATIGTAPTAVEIADQVWDEVLSSHLTAGTTGAALSTAEAGGDPWGTSIPGAYGAGTAGYIIGSYLDTKETTAGAVIRTNTAAAGGATSITLDASASAVDDFYNDKRITIVSGTGAGQSAIVSDYVGSTKVATTFCEGTAAGSWRTNPDNTSVFVIHPRNR